MNWWNSLTDVVKRAILIGAGSILAGLVLWILWPHLTRKVLRVVDAITTDETVNNSPGDVGEEGQRIQSYTRCLKGAILIDDRTKRLKEADRCEKL